MMRRCVRSVRPLDAVVRRGRRLALAAGAAGTSAFLCLGATPVDAQGLGPYLVVITNGPGGFNVQPGAAAPPDGAAAGGTRIGGGLALVPKLLALVVLVVVILLCVRWLIRSVRPSKRTRRSA